MSDAQRRECFVWITQYCDWATGIIFAQEIDQIGIKPATEKAMNQAVGKLIARHPQEIGKLKVDGRDGFHFPIFSETFHLLQALDREILPRKIIPREQFHNSKRQTD